jgi:hypothetical protein
MVVFPDPVSPAMAILRPSSCLKLNGNNTKPPGWLYDKFSTSNKAMPANRYGLWVQFFPAQRYDFRASSPHIKKVWLDFY